MKGLFTIKLLALLFMVLLVSCDTKDRTFTEATVGIQPYKPLNRSQADTIAAVIANVYGFKVHVLKALPIPAQAFVNEKSPRYRADKILKIQDEQRPDSLDYILGITSYDISTTKRDDEGNIKKPVTKYSDWGVFGLGYRPGQSCVVSTFRIKGEDKKFMERLRKICIHEIGHNLGLDHCKTNGCVMADAAETIATVDRVKAELCATCRRRLQD
ncbi:MAG TPA: matrixin family metalloprotease [Chryseolinea sp.]